MHWHTTEIPDKSETSAIARIGSVSYSVGVSVTSTENAEEFLDGNREFLLARECENNTLLSIASQAGRDGSLLQPPFLFVTVSSGGQKTGAAIHAAPDGLVMTEMPASESMAVAEEVISFGIHPRRVFASEETGLAASEMIRKSTGTRFWPARRWSVYYTEEPIDEARAGPGALRAAEASDEDTVTEFGLGYQAEKGSIVDVCEYFLARLREGNLHLWTHPGIKDVRTVVATSGKTEHVVRIAGVYTPPDSREQGYAASAVARVTNDQIRSGVRIVTLTVDQADDGARKLYEKLGFKHLHERVEFIEVGAWRHAVDK